MLVNKKVNKFQKIGILGYGNMGKAIFTAISKNINKDVDFYIYSRHQMKGKIAVVCNSFEELIRCCDVIFICIKPQDFKDYKFLKSKKLNKKTVFVSIMAGVTVRDIELKFETKRIVRTMPNLPLQIQKGVIGWFVMDDIFKKDELMELDDLLNCLGITIKVANEDQLNAITAISGSGPAYVFLFMDALVQAGVNLGISVEDSKKIAFKTIEGSLSYVESQQQDSLGNLIEKVTSKGGTTEAAFKEINSKQFYKMWKRGTQKAYDRARELSK